jgi:hypothetical protein
MDETLCALRIQLYSHFWGLSMGKLVKNNKKTPQKKFSLRGKKMFNRLNRNYTYKDHLS